MRLYSFLQLSTVAVGGLALIIFLAGALPTIDDRPKDNVLPVRTVEGTVQDTPFPTSTLAIQVETSTREAPHSPDPPTVSPAK